MAENTDKTKTWKLAVQNGGHGHEMFIFEEIFPILTLLTREFLKSILKSTGIWPIPGNKMTQHSYMPLIAKNRFRRTVTLYENDK